MPNPQQPELRRSGHNAVVDAEGATTKLSAEGRPGVGGESGPVPEDNLPGHHPGDEQDKPDGDDFVAKAREVAARAREEREAEEREADGQAGAAPAPAGTTSSAPPSSAPVADVPAAGGGTDTEADAPSATPAAVTAEALEQTPAGERIVADAPATTARSTSAPTASPSPSSPASTAPANPLVAIATFQWKVATFPVRVTLDVLGRIRRLL